MQLVFFQLARFLQPGKQYRLQGRVREIIHPKPEKLELFVKPQVVRNQQPEKKKNTQPEYQWTDFSHKTKLRKSFACGAPKAFGAYKMLLRSTNHFMR